MGTELQKRGLRPGECPELWNMDRPNAVKQVHKNYLAAGSDIVYTNTFGCNARKLAGSSYTVSEVAAKAVALARSVCKAKGFVALDIGPLGEMFYPNGTLHFEDAYQQFKTLAVAGEAAGADLAVVETMTDLAEARAAVLAVKENTKLPVFVTMSFEKSGRTFFGCTAESFAATFDALDVDALGINCSLGPVEILPIVKRIAAVTNKPLIVKANAGLPDPESGLYNISAEAFAQAMRAYAELGVKYLGGCCGTDPSYIKALKDTFRDLGLWDRKVVPAPALCTAGSFLPVEGIQVIGDRLDPALEPEMREALEDDDPDAVSDLAADQADAGAAILRLRTEDAESLRSTVENLQALCRTPLLISAADPETLRAGLRAAQGKCLAQLDGPCSAGLLSAAKAYGAAVILRLEGAEGVPESAAARLELAQKLAETAEQAGFAKSDLYIDCAFAADPMETLECIRLVKAELGLKTVLTLSEAGGGARSRCFLPLALQAGLDLPILNICDKSFAELVEAYCTLAGTEE